MLGCAGGGCSVTGVNSSMSRSDLIDVVWLPVFAGAQVTGDVVIDLVVSSRCLEW